MNEIESIFEKLEEIEKFGGIGAVILLVIIGVTLYLFWKYIVQKIELSAKDASEKSMKLIQQQIDKDLYKFQTKHQKQIDAVHETYQVLRKLTSIIKLLINGENFTAQIPPKEDVKLLIDYRHNFKQIFSQNRLLFPKQLCVEIDSLIPTIDSFIETYNQGLLDQSEEEIEINAAENNGLYIAGFWRVDAFDEILAKLDSILDQVECEFRKIYGTNE